MAKTGPLQFLRQVKQETSKVTWPTRRELIVTTIMVFIMVTLSAIFFFVVDQLMAFGFEKLFGLLG
jgi:preprotein translocase subunit SecE